MTKDTVTFFKRLSLYGNTSADIVSVFEMSARRIRGKKFSQSIEIAIKSIREGSDVSVAMLPLVRSGHIDEVIHSILLSAERSSSIPDSFKRIHGYVESVMKMKKNLAQALAYPLIVGFLAMSMVWFLIEIIFPKIIPMFSSMRVQLPPVTKAVLGMSGFISRYGLLVLFDLLVFAGLFVWICRRHERLRYHFHAFLLRVPICRDIIFSKESHRQALSWSLLIQGGMSFSEAIRLTNGQAIGSGNMVLREQFNHLLLHVEEGGNAAAALDKYPKFRDVWVDFLLIGERTGTLPQVLHDIHKVYEGFLDEYVLLLSRWSEPIALMISGGIVLLVSLSIIQPMYSIIQHVHP